MFIIVTVADTIRIDPEKFGMRTMDAIHEEIDVKYPNRVLYDRGLVITRFGDALEIGDGSCVPGDGGAHYETIFRLVVFRPFVDEICTGKVFKCTEEGVQVTLGGFFDDIFIPGYWMLRPSHYDQHSKLWVWVPPNYEEEDNGDKDQNGDENETQNSERDNKVEKDKDENDDTEERFEVEIGAEVRFRVKSLHFTQVTNTAKGLQATMTTTSGGAKLFPGQAVSGGRGSSDKLSRSRSGSVGKASGESPDGANGGHASVDRPVRKRSSSLDLTDAEKLPASFFIVASICEDGLGLTSWWTEPVEEDQAEDQEVENDAIAE